MVRTDFVTFRVNEHERDLIKTLAATMERNESDAVRVALREAARARGIALVSLPEPQPEPKRAA